MNPIELKAVLKAQNLRKSQNIRTQEVPTYKKEVLKYRKYNIIDDEMYQFNPEKGEYEKYDYMEDIKGSILK